MFGILWGVDLGRRAVGDGRGLPARQRSTCSRSSARTSASSGAAAPACRPAASAPGRVIFLTVDDARAHRSARRGWSRVVSARDQPRRHAGQEPLQRGAARRCTASSRRTRPSARSTSSAGRLLNWDDERAGAPRGHHRRRHGAAALRHARPARRDRQLQRHAVHGRRPDPEEGPGQQLQRARQRQGVRAVRGDGARLPAHRTRPSAPCRRSSSRRTRGWSTTCRACSTPHGPHRGHRLAARARRARRFSRASKGFDPDDRDAISMWDTSLEIADVRPDDRHHAASSSRVVGLRHAGARRHRRDEHHADRREGPHARDRRAQGARRDDARRSSGSSSSRASSSPAVSGAIGLRGRRWRCARLVNLLPMPTRFSGMIDHAGSRASSRVVAAGARRRRHVHVSRPPRGAAAAGRGASLRDVTMSTPAQTTTARSASR